VKPLRRALNWLLDYSERVHVPRITVILVVAIALRVLWIWVLFPAPESKTPVNHRPREDHRHSQE
jgi:NhaP-type Na+/H+ or K+/H+ antiporter